MPALLSAAFVVTAVFSLSNSPTPLYVRWQHALGFGSGTLTVIFAAYILGLLLTLVVAGQLSDHFGRKLVLLPGLAAAIIAAVLFLIADNVAVLIIARLLTGIAVGVVVSAGMAAVVDAAGAAYRPLAARLASVAMVLGAGLGPLLAGLFAQFVSNPVDWTFGVALALLTLAVAAVLSARPAARGDLSLRPTFRLRLPSVPAQYRRYVGFGIATFGPGITATSFVLSLGPSLLARQLGVTSPLIAGGTACVMFLVATGVQFAVARWQVRTIFAASATCTAVAMLALIGAVQFDAAPLLIASAVLAGAGQGLGQLGGLTLIGVHVPASSRAQGNALMNIGGYIPAGALPLATGYLVDLTSIPVAATTFGAAVLSAAVIGGATVVKAIPRNDTATGPSASAKSTAKETA